MLFREFNIIAAAAYAAEKAAFPADNPLWDELPQEMQNGHRDRVMALARGEPLIDDRAEGCVFDATAKAILDHNDGQGGLALEKIASIGNDHFNLGLVTEEQVAGRDIADINQQLLAELSGLRQLLGAFGQATAYYVPLVVPAPVAEPLDEGMGYEPDPDPVDEPLVN
jgi:hypothetical protein